MKAILYARFSPRRHADECDSIESQLSDMRAYCLQHGYEIGGEYSDAAFSGADHERPGLWQAIGALKRGNLLIVRNVNRLARDAFLSLTIERELTKLKVQLVALEGGTIEDDDPTKKLARGILYLVAEYERCINNARTKSKMLQHQAAGRVMGGLPFGKRRDPDNPSTMIEDSDEQRAIESIRESRRNGMGFNAIARMLNEQRIPCRGERWHAQTVKRICGRVPVTN